MRSRLCSTIGSTAPHRGMGELFLKKRTERERKRELLCIGKRDNILVNITCLVSFSNNHRKEKKEIEREREKQADRTGRGIFCITGDTSIQPFSISENSNILISTNLLL